ncbi:MAG: circadian clock protein KaiC [Proteobacteria bacterium]|nr:circadian clock protein KaiC [Burkholderiales bacterium]
MCISRGCALSGEWGAYWNMVANMLRFLPGSAAAEELMAGNDGQRSGEITKAPTGIEGLDEATRGGIPQGRTTLVEGGPGAGKTVLVLQSLVHAARDLNEPGIFVAFEEHSTQIEVNAAGFGWDLPTLRRKHLFFIDAQPKSDLIQSGDFDLRGLLAALDATIDRSKARRIAFDSIDVVLALLGDAASERREIYRLHEWLLARSLTAVITSKSGPDRAGRQPIAFMQFMVDCALSLEHRVVQTVSQRSLRVLKYRGTEFNENEVPFSIGPGGFDVASMQINAQPRAPVGHERLSSGVPRLDAMLGGGYFRGASILVTGAPGTAKSSLCAAFADAACRRGEATLLVSFDSDASEIVRNTGSIGIRLDRHLTRGRRAGLLQIAYARAVIGSAETHLTRIIEIARTHRARCMVIDPVSALSQAGNSATGHGVAERLIDWAKDHGITLLCSSLLAAAAPDVEGTSLRISTIADTWVHLHYLVRGGERNRGLSIVKSRGTAHSNQVRELLLSERGITLADAYIAGGEVLMGTLRWEREQADETARREVDLAERDSRRNLLSEEADLVVRLADLQIQLDSKRAKLDALGRAVTLRRDQAATRKSGRQSRRGADADSPKPRHVAR